jgi:Zn-dependent metalloprotease
MMKVRKLCREDHGPGFRHTEVCRNPLHCIIPVHILSGLAQNGTPQQRKAALDAMRLDSSFRIVRTGFVESNRASLAMRRTQRRANPGLRLLTQAVAQPQPVRTIYDSRHTQVLPGTKVRGEADAPVSDQTANQAFDDLGDTFDFYWNAYQRNSIDDQGLPLNGSVHFGVNYDNAFWDGQRMVFGDGDKVTFNSFTTSVDIIGHELTHGVTQHEANLIYWGQVGAMNESISDVFGSLVKQYKLKQTADKADWLIGQGLLASGINGVAIRSLKAPGTAYNDPALGGKDPQPDHMRKYVRTFQDNGGVHINSGIPNYAFYVTATAIGGYAWQKAGQIWYNTLKSPLLRPTAKFQSFASLTILSARQLYGAGGPEEGAVREGWAQVGITV